MNLNAIKTAFAAAIALTTFQTAPAMAIAQPVIPAGYEARIDVAIAPPVGMIRFCTGHTSQCRADDVDKVTMTNSLLATLQQVNARVNSSIRPRNDSGRDKWSVGVSSGDCEDYALTKRAALIRQGVPAGALRIATTTTSRGEPHAILVVKTTRGSYVLDNLHANVRPLGSTGYRIRMIATSNPMVWSAG